MISFDEMKQQRGYDEKSMRVLKTAKELNEMPFRETNNAEEIHAILGTFEFNPMLYYPNGVDIQVGEFGHDNDYRYINPDNIPKKSELETTASQQIGDGKLPNKYWVTASNDYYYFNREEHAFDWISDKGLFLTRVKTLAVFDTYAEAKDFAISEHDTGLLYVPADKPEHFRHNTVSVEDRFTGQLFEISKAIDLQNGTITIEEREDTRFTAEAMAKRGATFK